MTTTTDIVAKLWSLCHILRDDGVTYNEYVTELTFLLFLKMLEETKKEDRLPKAYRWSELAKRDGLDQLDYYKRLLLDLGKPQVKDPLVQAIFTDAQTRLLVYRFDFRKDDVEGWLFIDPSLKGEPEPKTAALHAETVTRFYFNTLSVGCGAGVVSASNCSPAKRLCCPGPTSMVSCPAPVSRASPERHDQGRP